MPSTNENLFFFFFFPSDARSRSHGFGFTSSDCVPSFSFSVVIMGDVLDTPDTATFCRRHIFPISLLRL